MTARELTAYEIDQMILDGTIRDEHFLIRAAAKSRMKPPAGPPKGSAGVAIIRWKEPK